MKQLILFCSCLLSTVLLAQGPQQLVTVPIGPGSTVQAWLYLPADYATTTRNYPVVFFYHGSGEAGSNPNQVLNNGIPRLIADGMRPDSIVNPVDGEQYSFIVLSPQHWSWSPNAEWLPTELAWLKQQYRVDTNRIYVTGLSAGGQQAFNAAVHSPAVSSLIAAAVPMSLPALGPYDISMIGTYHIKTWFLSGATDTYTPNARNYSDQANAQYPGSSKLTVYPGGHCCWRTYYNTTWHDTATGLSIWQWLLTNTRQQVGAGVLPVKFSDFKATALEGRKVKISFTCADADGNERFYIRLWVKEKQRDILIEPTDRTGPNTYSKIINIEQ